MYTHSRTPVELVTRDGKINKSGSAAGGQYIMCTYVLPGENILCRERRISIACQPICHLHDDGRCRAPAVARHLRHRPVHVLKYYCTVFSTCDTCDGGDARHAVKLEMTRRPDNVEQ